MKRRILLLSLLLFGSFVICSAMEQETKNTSDDTPIISLLTCGPTDDYVFYLYGHTALRVQYRDTDLVYNYGYFSLEQKNFILNFILGKPMYSVGTTTFEDFLYEYHLQGRSVIEQDLLLLPDEAKQLLEMLEWNVLPENRDYMYNFYFDNCATRPRDLIEKFTGGLDYRIKLENMPTFREAIRNKSYTASWYTTGADCCLGWKSDERMSLKDAAFLPELLLQEFDHAYRVKDGQKLVTNKRVWLEQTKEIGSGWWANFNFPLWTSIVIGLIYFGLYLVKYFKGKALPLNILRRILYVSISILGIIVWFLALFSQHPHTFPNANMLLLHPLYILLLITMGKEKYNKTNNWLYFSNFVAIIIYLGLGYKQVLPIGVPFLAMIMAVDQLLHFLENKKLKKVIRAEIFRKNE